MAITVDRHIGVGIESSFNTQAPMDKYLKFENETLKEVVNYYDHETTAYNMADDSYIMHRHVEGDVTIVPTAESLGEILYCFLPNYSAAAAGTNAVHTYDDGTTSANPSLTMRVHRSIGGVAAQKSRTAIYAGLKPTGINFKSEAGQPLITTISFLGAREVSAQQAGSAASYRNEQIFLHSSGSFFVNGTVRTTIKALNLDIKWDYDPLNDIGLGSTVMADLKRNGLKISGDFTLNTAIGTFYDVYRKDSGTVYGLHLHYVGKSAGGTSEDFYIRIPKIHFVDADEGCITKRERNTANYSFVGNWSTGSSVSLTMILDNYDGTYS